MEKSLKENHNIEVNDVHALMDYLHAAYTRRNLEEKLHEHLFGTHFLIDAHKPNLKSVVDFLVEVSF